MTKENELVVIEENKIPEVFKAGGLDPIIESIREEVSGIVPDLTTEKGRKEIASIAYKVSKSKTYLDSLGKELVSSIKAQSKVIDNERKKMRDALDDLRDEVRLPLTEWEEAQEKRKNEILKKCNWFSSFLDIQYQASEQLAIDIKEIESTEVDDSFAEYKAFALKNKDTALTQLKAKLIVITEEEKQREAERIKEEQRKAQEQKEREEQIAKEAAERAMREAEEKAKAEKEAAEKRELELKLAKEKAEKEALEAAAKAERDKKEAIEAERTRIENERLAKELEEKKRQENLKHRKAVNNAAKKDLIAIGLDAETAETVIKAIAKNQIKHVIIKY